MLQNLLYIDRTSEPEVMSETTFSNPSFYIQETEPERGGDTSLGVTPWLLTQKNESQGLYTLSRMAPPRCAASCQG